MSEQPAAAEAIVYDAAGLEIERFMLVAPGGIAQRGVTANVTNGRAVVRFTTGTGRAYSSVLGSDATFFAAR